MKFPILYKKTSTGAIQMWEIATLNCDIITRFGQVDGKIQLTRDTICDGKNIGRSNSTTPEEQAKSEAQSQWEKKVKKGYVEDIDRAENGKTDIEGGTFPMLAKSYKKDGDKIKFPAYVQPKLDGHRCLGEGNGKLWSRTRKPITSSPHISKAVNGKIKNSCYFDGELYNHNYKNNFEHITHLIRQEEPTDGHENIQYHIYDVVMPGTFEERNKWLINNIPNDPNIILVETLKVGNENELMEAFEKFIEMGYEGAIVRNANGLYVNKRSADLQKIKEFDDSEFKIIGIEEGRGKLHGHVGSFICVTKNGEEFKAKMKGEINKLKEYFDNNELWEKKVLTVQYQGLTKYGIPRFPVGLRIRKDI